MRDEIIEKLMKIGYSSQQSNDCYLFYEENNRISVLNDFADEMIEMMELDRRLSNG